MHWYPLDPASGFTMAYHGIPPWDLTWQAAMGPCRDEGFEALLASSVSAASAIRPVARADFDDALCQVECLVEGVCVLARGGACYWTRVY